MSRRQSWGLAAVMSLIAAGSALFPYWLAEAVAGPGAVFSGFLINPQDGFSYLAKMRQGAHGSWGFVLPYAADPGEQAFLFVHYLALGHLARWLGVPLLQVYHAARIFGTLLMYLAAFAMLELCLSDLRARWSAFLLVLFGSGMGWMGLPFGLSASDLLIPEAVPWFSALVNAHFPLASAALLGLMHALGNRHGRLPRRALIAASCALGLAVLQPFALLTPAPAVLAWMVLGMGNQGDRPLKRLVSGLRSETAVVLGVAALTSLPVLLYDYWITQAHPALHSWSLQNQTPAPSIGEAALGFGLPLLLAGLAVWKSTQAGSPEGRLMLSWFVAGFALVYLPFPLQRRMLLGLFFPLAGLAGLGLAWLADRQVRLVPAVGLALALGLPSNLIVAGAGVAAAANQDPAVTLQPGTLLAFRWLDQHAAAQAVVLAGPRTGNRLPAYADLRVLYGHPFETPGADRALADVIRYFGTGGKPDLLLRSLQVQQVAFVIYGPEERSLGTPAWLEAMLPVFVSGQTTVYRVPNP